MFVQKKENYGKIYKYIKLNFLYLCLLFGIFVLFSSCNFLNSIAYAQFSNGENSDYESENVEILGESGLSDHYFSLNDLYLTAYEEISETGDVDSIEVRDKTYFAVAKSLNVEKKDLELMLIDQGSLGEGVKQEALQKFTQICSSNQPITIKFERCQIYLAGRIQEEFDRQQFQEDMHDYALMSHAFANGTLQDTRGEFFDIIVDLNIIDVLLFGDKMNIPLTGSPFLAYNPFSPDADESSNTAKNTPDGNSVGSSVGNTNSGNISSGTNDPLANSLTDSSAGSDTGNIKNTDKNSLATQTDNRVVGYTTTKEGGFCVDPDGVIFRNIETHTVVGDETGDSDITYFTPYDLSNFVNPDATESEISEGADNSTSVSASYGSVSNAVYPNNFADIQLGNIINPDIKYRGGVYPDLSHISNKKKCDDDEDPFLNGRVCIKKICNEVLCIKINFKKGGKERDTPLRKMDCVECHIDRGNEALSPFIGTLGQNTPNQHPMESNFLSAFGNLRKSISTGIYLHPQRLPFLMYDQAHPNMNKEEKAAAEKKKEEEAQNNNENTEEGEESKKSAEYEKNKLLYNALLVRDCIEIGTNFDPGEGYSVDIAEYCRTVDRENTQLEEAQKRYEEKKSIKNKERSNNYDKMLRPFLQQFTSDMVIVNNYLQTIDPANIKSKAKQCK